MRNVEKILIILAGKHHLLSTRMNWKTPCAWQTPRLVGFYSGYDTFDFKSSRPYLTVREQP